MSEKSKQVPLRLSLRITAANLKEIVSGIKKKEYRDFSEYYVRRICEFENGDPVDLIPFDELKLYVGNNPKAPYAVVEVMEVNVVEYTKKPREGAKLGDIEFVFDLGRIIKTNVVL